MYIRPSPLALPQQRGWPSFFIKGYYHYFFSFFSVIHLQALMENILASKAQFYNNYCEYFTRRKADY